MWRVNAIPRPLDKWALTSGCRRDIRKRKPGLPAAPHIPEHWQMEKLSAQQQNYLGKILRENEQQAAEIERLTRERDEWKDKWIALARASLIMSGDTDEQSRGRTVGVMICPDCKGERRGPDGALCRRCKGNAQINVYEQSMPAQVPGGPTCHPGALWEASSPTTGVSRAVCSICKQPAN